jgi:hypothetical protein
VGAGRAIARYVVDFYGRQRIHVFEVGRFGRSGVRRSSEFGRLSRRMRGTGSRSRRFRWTFCGHAVLLRLGRVAFGVLHVSHSLFQEGIEHSMSTLKPYRGDRAV